MLGEEILVDIDETLSQLIKNAEALNKSSLNQEEKEAFAKTQESLLAHLMHMDEMLAKKRKSIKAMHKGSASLRIQEKLLKFDKLHKTRLRKKIKVNN
ncbi:MAG: hypothetical protein HZB76_00905 [Chlamydiae bacterium]|nr:hypothetical protein [Chlamydiota bacterium]